MTEQLIRPAVIEQRVRELARFGKTGETGVSRTVFSPEWVAAQDQIEEWMRDAGLEARRDAVGNVWGRLEGTEAGPVDRHRLARRLADPRRTLRRRARHHRRADRDRGAR